MQPYCLTKRGGWLALRRPQVFYISKGEPVSCHNNRIVKK